MIQEMCEQKQEKSASRTMGGEHSKGKEMVSGDKWSRNVKERAMWKNNPLGLTRRTSETQAIQGMASELIRLQSLKEGNPWQWWKLTPSGHEGVWGVKYLHLRLPGIR